MIHTLGTNKVVKAVKKSLDDMLTSHSSTREIPINQRLDDEKVKRVFDKSNLNKTVYQNR